MNFRSSKRKLLTVYRGMPRIEEEEEGYDLLLTPQLYLMKRERLPVRFLFEARRIAPSLMEELGTDDSWIFELFRDGEEWIVVAYHPDDLLEVLRKARITPGRIGRIYFAQQFSEALRQPLLLGDREAMATVKGIVTILPSSMVVGRSRSLDTLPRPDKSFPFRENHGHQWMGRKTSIGISLLLLLLALFWVGEGLRYRQERLSLEAKVQEVSEGDPTLVSAITRRNIRDRYRSIDRRQRQIRTTMRKIGRLISKETKLSRLNIDTQGYEAIIETTKNRLHTLKELADSLALPSRSDGKRFIVKGTWR